MNYTESCAIVVLQVAYLTFTSTGETRRRKQEHTEIGAFADKVKQQIEIYCMEHVTFL